MDLAETFVKFANQQKSVQVDKLVPVYFDLGNLACFDLNVIENSGDKLSESALLDLARDNCQLLINEIFGLPTETVDIGILAKLPEGTTLIPREKPLPKAKEPTKWEKFAVSKGIHKKKRSAMVFDEASDEYKPRHGAKSKKNESLNDWCIEVPDKADPFEDQYAKRKEEKRERVRKNDARHKRNLEGKTKKSK